MAAKSARTAYNVRWADGRAVVSYPDAQLAAEAAKRLNGRVQRGPAVGRIRTKLPPKRDAE